MARKTSFAALVLALAGCSALRTAPQGDVIAVVDGIEVTSAIVEAEARAAGLPLTGPDAVKNRDMMIRRAVERTLLVAEANRRELPRQPAYLAEREIAEDNLLADKAIAALVDPDPAIDDAAVKRFIVENPQKFADRQALHIDQIRFDTKDFDAKSLTDARGMDAVLRRLEQRQVVFDRTDPVLDSATLPRPTALRLMALGQGEPAFHSVDGSTYVAVVLNRIPLPYAASEQAGIARRTLAGQERERQIGQQVAKLQKTASITYQKGYAPLTSPVRPE